MYEEVFCKFGVVEELLSDRGLEYLNKVVSEVCKILAVRRTLTAAYNPKCNGLAEKVNGLISIRLAKVCKGNLSRWDRFLPFVTHCYNITPLSSLKVSPFEIVFNRQPKMLHELDGEKLRTLVYEPFDQYLSRQHELNTEKETLVKNKRDEDVNNQEEGRTPEDLNEKDLVMKRVPYVYRKKLNNRFEGPFKILRCLGKGAYELCDLNGATTICNRKDIIPATQYQDPEEWHELEEGEMLQDVVFMELRL